MRAPSPLLAVPLLVAACTQGSPPPPAPPEPAGQAVAPAVPAPPLPALDPLSPTIAGALCSFRGGEGEAGLVRRLGEPEKRSEREVPGGKLVVLTWEQLAWKAAATVSGGQVKVASAQAVQPPIATTAGQEGQLPQVRPGVTKLTEVEAALGPSVRTGVAWHMASPGASSELERQERCGELRSWLLPGTRRLVTLEVQDGVVIAGRL